jgi:UDP-N-acetylmuramoylalanine--D-glutamate ligase
MKIAIIGFVTDGRSTYEYFAGQNQSLPDDQKHELTICDQNEALTDIPTGAQVVLGGNYLDNLDRFDLIIRTSGMHPRKILEKNPTVAHKISTNINEFLKASPTQNIIGVTGTKGKGTTSTLITKILEAHDKTVRLGGNIGLPPLTFIEELDAHSWVVLELSSYQLVDLQASPRIAVCLMIVPEHLDWHGSLEDYITAKEQLFARQATGDTAIFFHDNATSKRIANAGQGQKIPYFYPPGAEVEDGNIVIEGNEICKTSELKLLGEHNWQNVCAAVTAVWYAFVTAPKKPDSAKTPDPEIATNLPNVQLIREVLTSFSGLPFRIEYRGEKRGVEYYNDSFASAPPAPVAAIEAIPRKQVVILGGFDRQLPLDDLVAGICKNQDKLRNTLIVGAASQRLAIALQDAGFTNFILSSASDMPSIVREATALAQPGDAVVLSPGFPSFDMFKNFEDRGRQFNDTVEQL